MSTFNGLIAEFPDIRVDFFRSHPELRPPLACFLSHIHSDHLSGLESLRSPFVYCSAATREMLLRLERYPCRINYAMGILEARIQRYRHLRNLLKPIPLETPVQLELEPGNHLQVTLFDANHCPGAVMFLFEDQGKAVLYTGDIRSEPWFVNAITRSPSLIEYSAGLKTLDTIYLDTSFTDNIEFATKSEGIAELLQKVSRYPADTIFHFQAWTYGYEDVWIALSKAVGSKIHVDEYKMRMFRSLVTANSEEKFAPSSYLTHEAPGLVGFTLGNTHHDGCLTLDETVRLHSCEKGTFCNTVQSSPVVWIRPIITRINGQDVAEAGVGGGGEDLEREAELDYLSPVDVEALVEALSDIDGIPDDVRDAVHQLLLSTIASGRKVPVDLERTAFGDNNEVGLSTGLQAIASKLKPGSKRSSANNSDARALPNVITFPYSRHSSYPELVNLVGAFKPRDIWPCTVDVRGWLQEGITVQRLFSENCSGNEFRHDQYMKKRFGQNMDSQSNVLSAYHTDPHSQVSRDGATSDGHSQLSAMNDGHRPSNINVNAAMNGTKAPANRHAPLISDSGVDKPLDAAADLTGVGTANLGDSQASSLSEMAFDIRWNAFQMTLDHATGRPGVGIGLLSTTDNHTKPEDELTYSGPWR